MNNKLLFVIIFFIRGLKFTEEWHNLKLEWEYSNFVEEAKSLNISNEKIEFFTKNILLNLKEFIYYTFKVKEESIIDWTYYYNKSTYDLEPIYGSEIKGKDLVIKILSKDEDTSTLAEAIPVGFNIDTNRPNIGFIWINLHYIKNLKNTEEYYSKNLMTIIHETFHIWGYNNIGIFELDDKFSMENNFFKIFSPKVLEYGKKQYGCNNLKSLNFENNLSPHWEDIQFGNEIQMAISKRNLKISEITLGFFEDLGWYKVNYNMSEILPFGLKKGCEFINNPSPKFEEFSKKKGNVCSNDYTSIASYFKTIVSNNLFIKNNTKFCSILNKNSSCLEIINSDEINPVCSESKCLYEENKFLVQFRYNDIYFNCKKDEEIIEENEIKIKCPKIKKFCEYRYECKNNCNGKGICLNGNCICNKKYKGLACEFENKKEINSFDLNKKCNFNGHFEIKEQKCNCYDNYKGNNCEDIIINLGSFGSNCKISSFIKCGNHDYYKFINKYHEIKTKKKINTILSIKTNWNEKNNLKKYGHIDGKFSNLDDKDFKNDKDKLYIFKDLYNELEKNYNDFLNKLSNFKDIKNKKKLNKLKNKINKTKKKFIFFKNFKINSLSQKNNKYLFFPMFNRLKITIKKWLRFIRKFIKNIKIIKVKIKLNKTMNIFRNQFKKIKKNFRYIRRKNRKRRNNRKNNKRFLLN